MDNLWEDIESCFSCESVDGSNLDCERINGYVKNLKKDPFIQQFHRVLHTLMNIFQFKTHNYSSRSIFNVPRERCPDEYCFLAIGQSANSVVNGTGNWVKVSLL